MMHGPIITEVILSVGNSCEEKDMGNGSFEQSAEDICTEDL